MGVLETLEQHDFFDEAIIGHGFTESNRDYRLVASICGQPAADLPVRELYTYTFLFKACVEAHYSCNVEPDAFTVEEVFVDYARWKDAGTPDGFVWGVNWALAYPGLTYVESSEKAAAWSEKLGLPMHEVFIETNTYELTLIFHDVSVTSTPSP